jgi:hypothetical protein
MHGGKKLIGVGAALGLWVGLAGCTTSGRSLDTIRGRAASEPMVRATDIPLVAVPPPPLGAPAAGPTSAAPAPPPPAPPPSAPPPPAPPPLATSALPPPPAPPAPAQAARLAPPVPAEAPTPVSTLAPAPVPAPAPAAAVTARQLYETARDRFAGMDSYIARLTRQEVVGGKRNPEEVIAFSFRKQPWSVHFRWVGKEACGREIVYVKGRYEGKLHTLLAAGDSFLLPAGRRISLLPDNPLVLDKCRHPVTEAGIGAGIERIGTLLEAQARGDRRCGTLRLVGAVKRPEFAAPACALEHRIPPGYDAGLPKGGTRTWYFDPELKLPTLLVTLDENKVQVEYYRYDRLQHPVKLDDDDFNPDKLWKKSMARAPR